MPRVSLKQLLLAGSHFGHLTRRWNPKMDKYIFMQKNGIHIIDLKKTQFKLEEACNFLQHIVQRGDDVLFVGTKPQAREMIREETERIDMFYVNERWLGGMLTNFRTIRNSIRKLDDLEMMETNGTYQKLNKKEILQVERQKAKLLKVLGGVRKMKRLPGAVFVIDIRKEDIAVHEAHKLGIPVFAIIDTNADPTTVEYPIPANDDAYKSIALITHIIADAVEEAKLLRQEKAGLEEELAEKQEKKGKKPQESAPVRKPARRRRSPGPAAEGKSDSPQDVTAAEKPAGKPARQDVAVEEKADTGQKPARKVPVKKEVADTEQTPVKKASVKKEVADTEQTPVKKASVKKDVADTEQKPVKKASVKKDVADTEEKPVKKTPVKKEEPEEK